MFTQVEPHKGLWSEFFQVGPVVLITTRDVAGRVNVAPKTQVTRIGRGPFIGFGCTSSHHTFRNAAATMEFVVNYPGPGLLDAIRVAGRSFPDGCPDELEAAGLSAIPSARIAPPRIGECYAHLECRLCEIRSYGKDAFIVGEVVTVWVRGAAGGSRGTIDDVLREQPLLAYIYPDHYFVVNAAHPFDPS